MAVTGDAGQAAARCSSDDGGIMVVCPRSTMTSAALRRLRTAFGFVHIIEVICHDQVVSNDPEDEQGGGTGELGEGARMADPRRMTPEEHGEAHALLVRAVTDPDWQAASQALDDLMGKLLVVRRLLEAEEHLPQRAPRGSSANPTRDAPA
jgi:hypothetical protein